MALQSKLLLPVVICLVCSSCTTIRLDEDIAAYSGEISKLQRQLLVEPQSEAALRELGAIHIRTGYPAQGFSYLDMSYRQGDREPKTLFYLGLANESLGHAAEALEMYQYYSDVSPLSPYRGLMEGRYNWLVREAAHSEIQERLAHETDISDTEIVPEIVAIFPFAYIGDDDRFGPLGRGLAEWMTIDLQYVSQIRVVERTRLQAILSELNFSASDLVDQSSAPRLGRILRAGKVVGGTFNVLSESELRLDASFVETLTSELYDLGPESDALNSFFRLEKKLVFSLLAEMGIELTEAEQAQIEHIPTQNLQAFLAYCRGLLDEDENGYAAAAQSFQQAASLDPNFSEASQRNSEASGMSEASGSSSDLLQVATSIEPIIGSQIDLVASRMNQLGIGIGSTMVPGADDRDPVEEATTAGVGPTGLLPPAPSPPGGN